MLHPTATNLPRPSPLVQGICQCKTTHHLKQIHAKLIKTGEINDPIFSAELLQVFALSYRLRDLSYARLVFRQMRHPNRFSYNTMIRALSESENFNDLVEALAIFNQMLYDDFVFPNRFTFPSLFKACARTRLVDSGKQAHGLVVKLGLEEDEFVLSNLVKMYINGGAVADANLLFRRTRLKCEDENDGTSRRTEGDVVLWNVMVDGYVRLGELKFARKLFDEMPSKSVVSWNGMIAGYAQCGQFMDAIDVFRAMQVADVDVQPNYVTLVSVLPAVTHLGALELGKWVHLYAERQGIDVDDVLGSALVNMYSKSGSIEKALQVFESLPKRNPITWNAIINGLAIHGLTKEAIEYFDRMEQHGVEPTDVTFISLLTACSHGGLVSEGKQFFNRMVQDVGLEPRIEHYGCMVDLLGRNGHLREAEELILSMPITPDDVALKALLGACKVYGDIEMGKRVARRLMEMVPSDSGSYVALSNIYASLGDWEAVSKVRIMMKEMDIRKDPGCSWIEVEGVIHEFVVEDDSHPQAREIHAMLEEMLERLSVSGYRPDTSQVLLNVDEEEKQSALSCHSEKIAVAFGLISTSPQTALRVVKNLRICDDCHTSMKLIAKIFNRKIVVRDRKRFHHFVDGKCSCRDKW